MIERLLLSPPLAYGRLGPSATPCDSFHWGPNDLHPRGTGKTTVQPAETLSVGPDGVVTASTPETVQFKDAAGFRPVAPFFELHAEWTADGARRTGPVTEPLLHGFGLSIADLRWEVEVANLKAFHYTLDEGDRIEARLVIAGDDCTRHELAGVSPESAERRLVPVGTSVPLGSVQLTRPTAEFPELRLRFTPAAGHVYGPTDLADRSTTFVLPAERQILDPAASWCGFQLSGDPGIPAGGLFAGAEEIDTKGALEGNKIPLHPGAEKYYREVGLIK